MRLVTGCSMKSLHLQHAATKQIKIRRETILLASLMNGLCSSPAGNKYDRPPRMQTTGLHEKIIHSNHINHAMSLSSKSMTVTHAISSLRLGWQTTGPVDPDPGAADRSSAKASIFFQLKGVTEGKQKPTILKKIKVCSNRHQDVMAMT